MSSRPSVFVAAFLTETSLKFQGSSDKAAIHETRDKGHGFRDLETKSEPPISSSANETLRTSAGQESTPMKNLNPEEEKNETGTSQEKMIKKPDKILPCPRCSSLDTKFCYYNNYNVNQPRHFCKHCQRYWTAGGTIRNVPIGAGRRKNKNSASLFRHHKAVSDATFQTVRPEVPDPLHHPPIEPNGTVLSFDFDTSLCESMASVFNLAKQTMKNCNQNGFRRPEEQTAPLPSVENGDEQSSGSSETASNSTGDGHGANQQEPVIQNCQGFPAPIPCINGSSPWPYPWSPVPAFCPSNYPLSLYPAPAYWGCAVPGTWGIPWISPPASSSNDSSGAGSSSPTLGKRSREGEVLDHTNPEKGDSPKQSNQERCLWIPKTLRTHDPEETAKSSIWETMGFRNDSADGISGGELFKAFQKKEGSKNHTAETSQLFYANPAALSRSLNFQEIS